MKYLMFTNTPAQVHLYRNAARELLDRGHDVLVMGRDYGCTKALLEYYDLPHVIYGKLETNKLSLVKELPKHYPRIFYEALKFDPDLVFGMGAYAAPTGAVTGAPVVLVVDTEPDGVDHVISQALSHSILTPHTYGKDLGEKHYVFTGFKECAYLHPDVYQPTSDIRSQLGVDEDETFAIVRLNAFGSHHDVGQEGFTPEKRLDLIEQLSEHATVFVSDERGDMEFDDVPAREFDLHPAMLHDALAEADLLVADTQTMVTEAALLGTPAIRSNSFVGEDDMGNFVELEKQGLIYNIADFDEVLETALDLITDESVGEEWDEKRDAYMADKVNLTDLLVDVATSSRTFDDLQKKHAYEEARNNAIV